MTQLALTPAASAAHAATNIAAEVRTLVVTGPNIPALLAAVQVDMEVAPTVDVDSDDMAAELQQMLGRLATVSSAIEHERKERKAPLLEVGKWLDDGYNPAREHVDTIIRAGKSKLVNWSAHKAELERRRREAEEAERRAAAEKAAREEAEAIAAAQHAAQQAQQLRAEGSEQVAAALETQAVVAVDTARQNAGAAAAALYVAPLRPAETAVKGQRENWKAECTDKAKLLQHIGERIAAGDRSLIGLVQIDPKSINAMAKVQKQHLSIPGLRAYNEASVNVRKVAVAA